MKVTNQRNNMKKYKDVSLSKKDWLQITLLQAFDSHFRLQVTSRKRQATRKVKHAS
jgi:hypothetical protein